MWDAKSLELLLTQLAAGETTVPRALQALAALPYHQVDGITLDHHRALRQGFAEVIFCGCKTPAQVADIAERLAHEHGYLLGTRATFEQFETAQRRVPDLCFEADARAIWLDRRPANRPKRSGVVLVTAGAGDLPIAREAELTLKMHGLEPRVICDVGVAGLHRLLAHVQTLQQARVVIVVAGMDAALASVVAGLVAAPVVAVPTSVGYGASFGGLAALLAMLNACAAGVAVVNIDNGYGAGCLAASIMRAASMDSCREEAPA